jgi:hydroxyethylthiazole kinase
MHAPQSIQPNTIAGIIARLRERRPVVHCITNAVAQRFTANILLAAGAVPAMTVAPEEIAEFVARADALLINLGTLDAGRREAAPVAIDSACKHAVPWVLDPVFVDRSPPRAAFAKSLLAGHPSVVRLNAAEFQTLAGGAPDGEGLAAFARGHKTVCALTGRIDQVADATRLATIANGDPLMERVTAMGCAASALTAACHAVEPDPWLAAVAALTAFGVAGEVAAERSRGPGSFATEFVDALYLLDREILVARARVA